MKAIEVIESAKSYYLLSNDHQSKPIYIGNRIKLDFALQDIDSDMVIATTGNDKRCVILMDYSVEDLLPLTRKADQGVLRLKSKTKEVN